MLDTPVDAWYVWLGLSVVSLAVCGIAWSMPTAPPPDAAGVAETVDRVATTHHGVAERPLAAEEVRLGSRRLGLRSDGGEAHATFGFTVVPVVEDRRLRAVVEGESPAAAFASLAAFRRAIREAQRRGRAWRPVDGPLVVRSVSWGGVDATLVAA